jgi:molecular chaperone DnaJ
MLGSFTSVQPCSDCGGTGHIIKDPCKSCGGKGAVIGERTIEASIPAGIASGQSIKLSGQGSAGRRGGGNGDLYITVNVKSHVLFHRQGNDISYDVPLTLSQAAAGCTVDLPTVDGDTVKQTIPEGTQHQTVFRIKNKGVPFVNGHGRGDMYVRVTVEVPKNLSRKQKDLLDQLEELSGDKNYDAVRKFKEKVEKIQNA